MSSFPNQQAIAANDKNVVGLTYKQLSDRFESPFDSAKGTAMQLSGITGLVGVKIATSAFKFYKIRQVCHVGYRCRVLSMRERIYAIDTRENNNNFPFRYRDTEMFHYHNGCKI